MSVERAKALRKQMTDAETRLWYHLRAHRFSGFKFKRQAPIGAYVVDFVSFACKIVIEVDGGQHAGSATDQRRDQWLAAQGFIVLRFWKSDVLKDTSVVLKQVDCALRQAAVKAPSPGALRAPPSPTRGEGKTESSR